MKQSQKKYSPGVTRMLGYESPSLSYFSLIFQPPSYYEPYNYGPKNTPYEVG